GGAHLRGAFGQPAQVAHAVAVDVLALGLGPGDDVAEAGAARAGLGMPVVLRRGFGGDLVELARVAAAIGVAPDHHDAVVVFAAAAVLGGARLVAQAQDHAVLAAKRVARGLVAARGDDAGVDVVLLRLRQPGGLVRAGQS